VDNSLLLVMLVLLVLLVLLPAVTQGTSIQSPTSLSNGQANKGVLNAAPKRATADAAVMLRSRVCVPFPQLALQELHSPHAVTLQATGVHSSSLHSVQLSPSGM
jgi:hypothetical protein